MKPVYFLCVVILILSRMSGTAYGATAERNVAALHFTGKAGMVYAIEYTTNASQQDSWRCLAFVKATAPEFVWDPPMPGPDEGRVYRAVPDTHTNMVFIAPGTFILGDPTKTNHNKHVPGDNLMTKVTITKGYWIAMHHVTQREFESLTGKNPSLDRTDCSRPVDRLNWFEATNYCRLLTEQESRAGRIPPGSQYRLPTEAEWEYANRAWATTRTVSEDDPSYVSVTNYAWRIVHGAKPQTRPEDLPEPSGLYDTRGRVSDWCQDWYGPYPGGEVVDPQGPPGGMVKVRCGGNLSSGFGCCAPGAINPLYRRSVCVPSAGGVNFGCRVVLAPASLRPPAAAKIVVGL